MWKSLTNFLCPTFLSLSFVFNNQAFTLAAIPLPNVVGTIVSVGPARPAGVAVTSLMVLSWIPILVGFALGKQCWLDDVFQTYPLQRDWMFISFVLTNYGFMVGMFSVTLYRKRFIGRTTFWYTFVGFTMVIPFVTLLQWLWYPGKVCETPPFTRLFYFGNFISKCTLTSFPFPWSHFARLTITTILVL